MKLRVLTIAAAFAASFMLAGLAPGEENKSPLPSHLPLGKEVCFGRTYDEAHLAKHPKQLVTEFFLYRDLNPDQNTEYDPVTPEQFKEFDGQGERVQVSAFVKFKNRKGVFWNSLSCGRGFDPDGKTTRCSIDCDGGSFTMVPRQKNIFITNHGFVLIGGCGATEEENEKSVFFSPGADDKQFILEPRPVSQCAALQEAVKPVYAKMGEPLRVRFATEGALCYSAVFEPGIWYRNPRRMVRHVTLLRKAGGKDVHKEAPAYDLTFSVELGNGKRYTKTARCSPDNYAYRCTIDSALDEAKDFYLTRAGNDEITIRDPRGKLSQLFGVKLGIDDRLFKLGRNTGNGCDHS